MSRGWAGLAGRVNQAGRIGKVREAGLGRGRKMGVRRVGTEAPCPGTAKSAEQEVSPAAAHERPAGHEEAPGRQSQEWCLEDRAQDMSG